MKEEDYKRIVRQMCIDGLVIEELGISHGQVIADVANLIEELWYGYEIKTQSDTLKRLPNQIRYYEMIFDYCTLFIHESHLYEATRLLPEHWGIIILKESGLVVHRDAKLHDKVHKVEVAELLWKVELMSILKDYGVNRISNLSSTNLRKLLVTKHSVQEIKLMAIEKMSKRTGWSPLKEDYKNGD